MTDAAASPPDRADRSLDRLQWGASLPFLAFHLLLGLVFVTGITWEWALLAVLSYSVRMFAVTAGYHRYFSHRSFKTNRLMQFLLAWVAMMSAQKGVLWWASHHRHHHKHSDTAEDIHSPLRRGFWWSHIGWILSKRHDETNYESIKDFSRFPELVWLNQHPLLPFLSALLITGLLGGLPALVWVGIVPTVLLWHATFCINSLSHLFGSRRYLTADTSRNSLLLALITFGEGLHNNHHSSQSSARQGWFWWELDLTFYALKVLSWFGLVWDVREPRPEAKFAYRQYTAEQRELLAEQGRFGAFEPRPPVPTPEAQPAIGFGDSALLKR